LENATFGNIAEMSLWFACWQLKAVNTLSVFSRTIACSVKSLLPWEWYYKPNNTMQHAYVSHNWGQHDSQLMFHIWEIDIIQDGIHTGVAAVW